MFSAANLFLVWRLSKRQIQNSTAADVSSKIQAALSKFYAGDGSSVVLRRKCNLFAVPLQENVLHDSQSFSVLCTKRIIISLDNWTAYLDGQVNDSSSQKRHLYVLLHATHPKNDKQFLTDILAIKADIRVELLSVCEPLAWQAGAPFGIMCRCSDEEFIKMADAFLRNYLIMEEMLQIDSISLVEITGKPQNLLPPDAQEYLSYVPTKLTDNRSDSSISLNDSTPIRFSLQEGSESATEESNINLQFSAEDSSSVSRAPDSITRPPNILIYTGKKFASAEFVGIKQLCIQCMGSDSYTIYHLKHDQVSTTPWKGNCALLIIATEQLYEGVNSMFSEYFQSGGKIVSFCSNLDKDFLLMDENERCNQIQVVAGDFSGCKVNAVQGRYYYKSSESTSPNITTCTLATNGLNRPVVIEACNVNGGICIFSQIHLEKAPAQYSISNDVLSQLSSSNAERIHILSQLFKRLRVQADNRGVLPGLPVVTTCHVLFIGDQTRKLEFMDRVAKNHPSKIKDKMLTVPNLSEFKLESTGTDVENSFNIQIYSDALTSQLGNTILYQEITQTTQTLLEPFLFCCPQNCGLVAIAKQQISGIGRGENVWLSPQGSLALSMHLRIDMTSNLGQAPALIQTIPAVAVARIIGKLLPKDGVERVSVKWPNDIYYKHVKIGGVLVKSTILHQTLHAIVGVGVNVCNLKPTLNLNDIIDNYNSETTSAVGPVTVEFIAAKVCSNVEELLNCVQRNKEEYMDEYYRYWMHTGGSVDVPMEDAKNAKILGLDDHGFLLLQKTDGTKFSVQPDGNTYDIMHNLIRIK